jgi:hypothetical protein
VVKLTGDTLFFLSLPCLPKFSACRMSRRNGTMNPPQLNANIEVTHKYRFISTAAFNGAITDALLLNAIGSMATIAAGTTSINIAQSVKLLRVEMWAPVSAQGSTTTVSLEWPATGQNMAREVTDTSVSVSRVAHINTKPPKNSLSGFWSTYAGAAVTLFNLVIPIATVLDVTVAFVLQDGTAPSQVVGNIVGGTTGTLYFGFLDSLTAAGAKLSPVALTPAP